jgi:23S rRNA (adenine2503-C2)-methyltransferase
MHIEGAKKDLKGLSRSELEDFVQSLGWERYRADQIFAWIYRRGAMDFDWMSNLAKAKRQKLKEVAFLSTLTLIHKIASKVDGTTKYLFQLEDGEKIESVLIKEGHRRTVCLSTQVGCGLGCVYCATGDLGLRRSLTAGEIVDQVLSVDRFLPDAEAITNVVLMGMGEPLLNYQETIRACRLMNDPDGLAIAARRITVSTAGVVPGIRKLAREGLRLGLAISLNATTDEARSRLIPVNKKYPLAQLISAAGEYAQAIGRPVTFEYVLIGGVNTSPDDALRLARLIRGIRCKINLIPYNEVPGKPYHSPTGEEVTEFMNLLYPRCPTVTLRESKGADIQAACGQLRGRER